MKQYSRITDHRGTTSAMKDRERKRCACGNLTTRKQTHNGKAKYGNKCKTCAIRSRTFLNLKGSACHFCGFVAVNPCQLDLHHKDRDRHNNDPSNLQTLCANCHRLQTWMENRKQYERE
jgi:hypothetical protein